MKTLINLVSGQTLPNLIAYKAVNPDKVIVLYSKDSSRQKDNFKSMCQKTEIKEYPIDAFNFSAIINVMMEIITTHSHEELVLNFTCGTKIMSVASYEVFKNKNLECIYIDSENGKIHRFKNGQVFVENLDIVLTLEEHLKLNGHIYQIYDEKPLCDERREYWEYMENNFNKSIGKFLANINDHFERNKNEFYSKEFSSQEGNNEYAWDNQNMSSKIVVNGKKFIIRGKDSIKYITGLWFEDLVYYRKFKDTNKYDDFKRNIHIQDKKGKRDMIELDIAGLHKNNFHLFELKSGKPRREAINNLRTIKEQLGTYTKLFLVSYFDLEDNDPLIERMQDLGIQFFKYSDFSLDKCFTQKNVNL